MPKKKYIFHELLGKLLHNAVSSVRISKGRNLTLTEFEGGRLSSLLTMAVCQMPTLVAIEIARDNADLPQLLEQVGGSTVLIEHARETLEDLAHREDPAPTHTDPADSAPTEEGRTRFFLGEVAEQVIRSNSHYYRNELLRLIPGELLNTEFDSENVLELGNQLDELRSKKENELSAMLRLSDPRGLAKAINSPLNTLPTEQEQKRREIKFLLNVAATLAHW